MKIAHLIGGKLRGVMLNATLITLFLAASSAARAGSETSGASAKDPVPMTDAPSTEEKWILIPMFSFSSLTGRPSWQEYDTQLFYKVRPDLTIGGEVDVRNRPPAGTDTLYSAMVSYYPWKPLEVHAEITLGPNVSFSPEQIYQIGFEVRPISKVSFLLDYQHYNYRTGSIDQIKPGITYWFTEETFLTARFAQGRAFGDTSYNGFGGRFNLGLPGKRRLILGYWHGADPERDIGAPDTTIIKGDAYSVFFQQPLRQNIDLIVGVEYEHHPHLYNRTTGTVGLSIKF